MNQHTASKTKKTPADHIALGEKSRRRERALNAARIAVGARATIKDAPRYAKVLLREVRRAGEPRPTVYQIAKRWEVAVYMAPPEWSETGQTMRVNGQDRIYLSARLSDADRALVCAHELGHYVERRWSVAVNGDRERWCWHFGAALTRTPKSDLDAVIERLGT